MLDREDAGHMEKSMNAHGSEWCRSIAGAIVGLVLVFAGAAPASAAGPVMMAPQANGAKRPANAVAKEATVTRLLAAARDAYAHGHIVVPASRSALADYLMASQDDPRNRVATDALREAFPYAVEQVERAIKEGNVGSAAHAITLLSHADPTNYVLVMLRAKLATRQNGQASSEHTLVLKASGNSWIKITDADGHLLDARTLRAGESRTYGAQGPLHVILGNAAAVTVISGGKVVSVKPDWHSKTARLELFTEG